MCYFFVSQWLKSICQKSSQVTFVVNLSYENGIVKETLVKRLLFCIEAILFTYFWQRIPTFRLPNSFPRKFCNLCKTTKDLVSKMQLGNVLKSFNCFMSWAQYSQAFGADFWVNIMGFWFHICFEMRKWKAVNFCLYFFSIQVLLSTK